MDIKRQGLSEFEFAFTLVTITKAGIKLNELNSEVQSFQKLSEGF